MTSIFRLFTLSVLCFMIYTPPAAAYIDPTAAGALLQSLYVMGVSLFMGLALAPRKIAEIAKGLLRRVRPGASEPE